MIIHKVGFKKRESVIITISSLYWSSLKSLIDTLPLLEA